MLEKIQNSSSKENKEEEKGAWTERELKLLYEKYIFRCMKKSQNDCTGSVNISIILNVDLAQKPLYVRPVDNNLDTKKAIRNHNRKAA